MKTNQHKENARLKRLLAERMLEVDALKELLGKKYVAQRRDAVRSLVACGVSVARACVLVRTSSARRFCTRRVVQPILNSLTR